MSLIDDFYNYKENEEEVISVPQKILFDIVDDFTDRRSLKQAWDGIDNDIKEEILESGWISY